MLQKSATQLNFEPWNFQFVHIAVPIVLREAGYSREEPEGMALCPDLKLVQWARNDESVKVERTSKTVGGYREGNYY